MLKINRKMTFYNFMKKDTIESLKPCNTPHVVILGAGASKAVTPSGEGKGRTLPVMNELAQEIGLEVLVDPHVFEKAKKDFESFFDELARSGQSDILSQLEEILYQYFDSFSISKNVTLYDRLVLSLRRKDVIATFNWDPLLPYAYRRNGHLKCLPALLFLHGNVKQGYCQKHNRLGWNDDTCDLCHKNLLPTKLLYPVGDKNYTKDPIISKQWDCLNWYIENAYFLTIFGYSAPKTDVDARTRIIEKLEANIGKSLMQIEVIDRRAKTLLNSNLRGLTDNTHYAGIHSFKESWLYQYPLKIEPETCSG